MAKENCSAKIGAAMQPRTETLIQVWKEFCSKYIVLTAAGVENEKSVLLCKMSPFFIEKAVASLFMSIVENKKRSGDLLLKRSSEADCKSIHNPHVLTSKKIAASLHMTLNMCRV